VSLAASGLGMCAGGSGAGLVIRVQFAAPSAPSSLFFLFPSSFPHLPRRSSSRSMDLMDTLAMRGPPLSQELIRGRFSDARFCQSAPPFWQSRDPLCVITLIASSPPSTRRLSNPSPRIETLMRFPYRCFVSSPFASPILPQRLLINASFSSSSLSLMMMSGKHFQPVRMSNVQRSRSRKFQSSSGSPLFVTAALRFQLRRADNF